MAQHLECAVEARRRMIRNVAHDLRTPLTNLQGRLEALQDGLRETDESALASLHQEAQLLSTLVSDLEGLAHDVVGGFVQSGRLRPEGVRATTRGTV